jgi:hypothetical protein
MIKNKKGILALQAVVTMMLSTLALLLLLQASISFLKLNNPENLDIARDNAQSIVDFIDYSNNKYDNGPNACYTLLKLKNLQNFQLNDQANTYFYLVTNDGVHIYKNEEYIVERVIKDDANLRIEREDYIEFKDNKKYNIFMEEVDITYEVFNVIFSFTETLLSLAEIGDSLTNYLRSFFIDDPLIDSGPIFDFLYEGIDESKEFLYDFDTKPSQKIVIRPKFHWQFCEDEYTLTYDNQNILSALNAERITLETFSDESRNALSKIWDSTADLSQGCLNDYFHDSHYIAYEPKEGIFPSYTSKGEEHIMSNLCEFKAIDGGNS